MTRLTNVSHKLVIDALCFQKRFPLPETEWRFDHKRKFRLDFAWVPWKVALEVEGGIFTGGRHSRGAGMLKDMEKYNLAAVAGWRIIRCTPSTMLSGFEFVQQCIPRPLDLPK